LHYLECTSFSQDNTEGYCELPSFTKHIWPLFEKYAGLIDAVYRIVRPGSIRKLSGKRLDMVVASLGPFRMIPAKQMPEVKARSFSGGHLDVFYKCKDEPFLSALIRLWPLPAQLSDDSGTLRLDPLKLSAVEKLLSSIQDPYVLVSFAHDGDPMYLFGLRRTLLNLEERARADNS
jgi:hypothetical protein